MTEKMENPEIEKARKAKAALKSGQRWINDTLEGNARMGESMISCSEDLERFAKSIGEGIHLKYWDPRTTSIRIVSLQDALNRVASDLRSNVV